MFYLQFTEDSLTEGPTKKAMSEPKESESDIDEDTDQDLTRQSADDIQLHFAGKRNNSYMNSVDGVGKGAFT